MIKAPGLRVRPRKDGLVYYWVASAISRKAKGYRPETVRLFGATEEERADRCQVLTAELREWLAGQDTDRFAFNGTIRSLIRAYQSDEDSPYHGVKHSTRGDYDYSLALLERTVGDRRIDAATRKDIVRWYRGFRAPAKPGEPERLRRAHGCMKMLRIIATYGSGMRYAGCRDLRDILADMEFELPAARDEALSFEQARSIVLYALDIGKSSIALAQALQFECSLRQVDVIGYWEPAEPSAVGIIDHGSRWTGGVTWADVSPSLVLKKRTTKTAARGEWDLTRCPLVMAVLQRIPAEQRVGPIVLRERTGLPYRVNKFGREWREIARACGVPDSVWNRDSRAGGITEGDEAGADPRDLQKLATHSDIKTTGRYIRSTTRKATDKVADLRSARRNKPRTDL